MSFVLDAQRRQAESASPEEAAKKAYEQAKQSNKRSWAWFAAVGLIIAALGFTWWLTHPTDIPVEVSTPAKKAAPTIDPELSLQARARSPFPSPAPAPTSAPPQQQRTSPQPLSKAPAIVQDTLLGFEYSSHIYSDEPENRLVFVNGAKLKTGDHHAGWVLDAIEEDGVVWSRKDERYIVPLLSIWEQ